MLSQSQAEILSIGINILDISYRYSTCKWTCKHFQCKEGKAQLINYLLPYHSVVFQQEYQLVCPGTERCELAFFFFFEENCKSG